MDTVKELRLKKKTAKKILFGEPLGATCGTILMGKLFRQIGSTKRALIGSVIGYNINNQINFCQFF